MKEFIKIYRDEGVCNTSYSQCESLFYPRQTEPITAHQICSTAWEDQCCLLVFPGGRDLPYHAALKGEGNRRIRAFVEKGGAFFGICAGAYYGCRRIEFDKGGTLEIIEDRELSFFRGIGIGPVYGTGTYFYNSEQGARGALISDLFNACTLKSYFNGGCYFAEAERYPEVTVISHYLDIQNVKENHAAIISISVGKGKAILSGVHIEYNPSDFSLGLMNEEMIRPLLPFESKRKQLLGCVINGIRTCPKTWSV